jgi:hypothetical protein
MRMKYMIVAAAILVSACDSQLVTDPTAAIDSETALTTARGIELALNGAYRSLQFGSREHVAFLICTPTTWTSPGPSRRTGSSACATSSPPTGACWASGQMPTSGSTGPTACWTGSRTLRI